MELSEIALEFLEVVSTFVSIYYILLLIRIALGWFQVDFFNPPFSFLSQLTDPYLNLFRGLVPAMGGIDFSPMLGFMVLWLVQNLLIPPLASVVQIAF